MLTNKEINESYRDLMEKRQQLDSIKCVIQESCRDIGIQISKEDVKLMEKLIEQTGQFRVMKNNYEATLETFKNRLKNAGFSDVSVFWMTELLRFENLDK